MLGNFLLCNCALCKGAVCHMGPREIQGAVQSLVTVRMRASAGENIPNTITLIQCYTLCLRSVILIVPKKKKKP